MSRHPSSGYTLIELSITLVVLGLIVGSAVVGTSGLVRSTRLIGATNTLVTDLHYARGLSTTRQETITISFGSGSYTVDRVSPPATLVTRICPRGVSYHSTGTATFFPWGLASPMTVTISNSTKSNVVQLAANGNVIHP